MLRTAIAWVMGAIVVACWIVSATAQQTRPGDSPTTQPVAGLIKQLDSDVWAEREAAEAELIKLGTAAAAPLKAAVDASTMDLEGKTRAERILNLIGVPEAGAVWRPMRDAEAAEVLQDGDVVVSCNGQSVLVVDDLLQALKDEDNTLECWHQGKGKFAVEAKSRPSGFLNWPDRLGIFEQVGEKGPWYDDVRQAIRFHNDGLPKAAGVFAKAWKDGCRDSVMVATWLEELQAQGAAKQLERLWEEELASAKLRFPPGDYLNYGSIPYFRARAKLAQGQREQAAKLLSNALDAAAKANAKRAATILRHEQMEMQLTFDSAEAAWKSFKEQQDTLYRDDKRGAIYFLCLLAMRLNAESGPDKVVELLKAQPESPTKDMLTNYYENQAQRAATAVEAKPRHWALVKSEDDSTFLRAPISHFGERKLANSPPPVRLECDMRLLAFPPERTQWVRTAALHLNGEGGVILRFNWDGSIKAAWGGGNGLDDPGVRDPGAWVTCGLEIQRDLTRVSINGRPQWLQRRESVGDEIAAQISCSGSTAEFRKIRLYVGTEADVDTAAIEQAFKALNEARSAGHPAAGIEPAKKLMEMLGKVPEAQAHMPQIAWEQEVLEGLAATAGWNMTSEKALTGFRNQPGWTCDQDALVGRKYGSDNAYDPSATVALPVGDFELRGVVDLTKAGSDPEVVFRWSSRDSAEVQCASITRTQMAAGNPRRWDVEAKGPKKEVQPFCLRVRGKEGVIFFGDGKAPAGRFTVREICPLTLQFYVRNLTIDGEVRLQNFTIRALSKEEKIEAAVEMGKP